MASTDDIYHQPSQMRRFNLHTGDLVEAKVRRPRMASATALVKVDSINGRRPNRQNKIMFENLTPLFPTEQLKLSVKA